MKKSKKPMMIKIWMMKIQGKQMKECMMMGKKLWIMVNKLMNKWMRLWKDKVVKQAKMMLEFMGKK